MKEYSIIRTILYRPVMGRAYRLGNYEVIVESEKVPDVVMSRKATRDDIERSRLEWPEDWEERR